MVILLLQIKRLRLVYVQGVLVEYVPGMNMYQGTLVEYVPGIQARKCIKDFLCPLPDHLGFTAAYFTPTNLTLASAGIAQVSFTSSPTLRRLIFFLHQGLCLDLGVPGLEEWFGPRTGATQKCRSGKWLMPHGTPP